MNWKILFFAIIGGILITLLTGLIPNTPSMLVGATHFGYPLAWLTRLVLAPQYFPWRVKILELIADIIIWSIILSIALFLLHRRRLKQLPLE